MLLDHSQSAVLTAYPTCTGKNESTRRTVAFDGQRYLQNFTSGIHFTILYGGENQPFWQNQSYHQVISHWIDRFRGSCVCAICHPNFFAASLEHASMFSTAPTGLGGFIEI